MSKNDLLCQIGKRIAAKRKQLNMTQEELASEMKVSTQMVSNAELGKKAIRPENIVKLCEILHMSADYLLTGKLADTDLKQIIDKLAQCSDTQIKQMEFMIDSCKDVYSMIKEKENEDDSGKPNYNFF